MSDRSVAGDERANTRDEHARTRWFLQHILPHEPALRGWLAHRRAQAAFDIDDIVQESYAALAERARVDDILNPRAYLFQVAHSLLVRNIRRARIVTILAVEDLGQIDFADEAATPEQQAMVTDDLRRLAEVIAGMPGQTREAFVLRRVHDLPQREIAERMGLSESTVEKHIVRGIRWLGDWFASGGNPPAKTSKQLQREQRRANGRARNQPGH